MDKKIEFILANYNRIIRRIIRELDFEMPLGFSKYQNLPKIESIRDICHITDNLSGNYTAHLNKLYEYILYVFLQDYIISIIERKMIDYSGSKNILVNFMYYTNKRYFNNKTSCLKEFFQKNVISVQKYSVFQVFTMVASAFTWVDTKEGYHFWSELNNQITSLYITKFEQSPKKS